MSDTEDQRANKVSMNLISRHLRHVLDEVAVITDELQEMEDRAAGNTHLDQKSAHRNGYRGAVHR